MLKIQKSITQSVSKYEQIYQNLPKVKTNGTHFFDKSYKIICDLQTYKVSYANISFLENGCWLLRMGRYRDTERGSETKGQREGGEREREKERERVREEERERDGARQIYTYK